jgi:hypothetical protein
MSISFSRSMRSLQSDSFRPSLATLIIASVLIIAWFAWLVFAQITLYATSQEWEFQRDGSLIVHLPTESVASLRPGQRGTLETQNLPGQSPREYPVVIADVPMRTQNHLAADTIKVTSLAGPIPPTATGGTVKIAVETVSPLTLITRAAEQATVR